MQQNMVHTGLAGQVMAGLKRRRNPAIGLRMTAMIDVIFLLLTFFVLTARFKQPESHLNVSLPKPAVSAAQSAVREPLSIRLEMNDSQCSVILPETDRILLRQETIETNLKELNDRLAVILPSYDIAGQGIELYCDDAVKWDYIVKVYDVLYRAGAEKIIFVTEEKIKPDDLSTQESRTP